MDMNNVTWDWALFDVLNFDGPAWLDSLMVAISGVAMWIPLYLLIIYMIWRRYSWRGVVALLVAVGVAMGAADIIAGIFKHSGPLKHLWESFPVRHRPMFDSAVRDLCHVTSYAHGPYGTVSAHAATTVALAWMSALAIRQKWYNWVIAVAVILICYSRIYLACHFPMDILIGAVVGSVCGLSIYFLWKKFDKVIEKIYLCKAKNE